ncbi:MAG: hypothetical protein MUP17_12945 [candidate division Zixibacteria bacterium]|nr:hypothetical protein [candidate division Zixibacteria bacterium]
MSLNLILCLVCKSNQIDVNRWEENRPIWRCSNCGNEDKDQFTIGRAYLSALEDEEKIIEEARKDMAINRKIKLASSQKLVSNLKHLKRLATSSLPLPSKKGANCNA